MKLFVSLAAASAILQASAVAQAAFNDTLVEHMLGAWKVSGQVMGHRAHHVIEAEWVLKHQFLRLHERTASDAPAAEQPYEAIWFLGYDPISEKYVLHLMDVFGARYSETLGYGIREGNQIRFTFEYPEGPFHTTYSWSPVNNSWQWLMEQKDKEGNWSRFADLTLAKAP
ncbi:MAG: hypothetical protein JO249_05245 [Acidobacteria bacterium]|nr:hypothetical protein [Acidobacteriota bacterium]